MAAIFTDEYYHRETITTDETITTTKFETVPIKPPKPSTTTTTIVTKTNPTSDYVSRISPRVSRIRYRSPSIRSVRVHSTPRVNFIPTPPLPLPCTDCCRENVIDIKIEKENDYPKLNSYEYKYDYSFNETFERKNTRSKSMTRLNDTYELEKIELKRKPSIRNVSVVYESNKNDKKHVHFNDNIENDCNITCVSSLVTASPTFLPVNRSIQVGSIFNGHSFGLLCKNKISI
jgi:hypothetical protein